MQAHDTLDPARPHGQPSTTTITLLGLAAASTATATWVAWRARRAERQHPPAGRFMHIAGVRLHYVERGQGEPIVLLHGNMVTHADFEASGLIDQLAQHHRVIAFDRPGFGHSSRPRDRRWTASAQADVLSRALQALEVERAVVLGHSIGTLVALALALDHPGRVAGLVLVGGYYYPTLRWDALLTAPAALPVLGDVMRYTSTALTARAGLGAAVRAMFAPDPAPPGYQAVVPRELMLRPSQLRADAEDAACMRGDARRLSRRYAEITVPVTLVAGEDDKVVDLQAHSSRLHRELPQSRMFAVPRTGHMAHHSARDLIVRALTGALQSAVSLRPAQAAVPPAAAPAATPQQPARVDNA
ncbi:alpha/beta fold hydrolase [Ramlibacter tataouinensis]|uniref:Alpha/beta hydolase superfamily-like protein n=1 Tax=Ramlibacter tataouinensis (strain ATCC BAA-407 / DSM 14655 / LMG 21543 / TTB310) TaxID=365046 RepID=F5XWW4_RAMTT|nr:alpha/beta hydrolase [Ramlibacter tataouinensis]AEG91725.1 Alpha/beta hydolase superfamily-like protein [Ramlibacter tataouinensis TTB310]